MDISTYMSSTHLALQHTLSMAVADMAMNSTAANMATLVSDMTEMLPPQGVDGLGVNLDVMA